VADGNAGSLGLWKLVGGGTDAIKLGGPAIAAQAIIGTIAFRSLAHIELA